jgi:hypothetical protein
MSQHTPVADGNTVTCLDCKVLPPFSIVLCPLHAAALELLKALERVTAALENADSCYHEAIDNIREYARPEWEREVKKARAAIAKAEGESEGGPTS